LWRGVPECLAWAPGTHFLLLILAVTTLVLRGVDAPTAVRLLRHQSTNLLQMSRDAPRVLVLSAFLLDRGRLGYEAVVFTLVLAPVERWIGTYRWLGVFAAGHIGATLATTIGIWLQVRAGADPGLAYPVDVGVSYGVAAVAAVLAYRLPRPAARAWLGLLAVLAGNAVIRTGTFTDWGHVAALAIGFALGPLVRPERRPGGRHRVLLLLGTGLLGVAGGLAALLAVVPNPDIVVPGPGQTVTATVLGRPPGCVAACRSVVVRYGPAGATAEGVLLLPQATLTRPGDRVVATVVPGSAGRLRPFRPPQRVRLASLFGALSAAAGATGAALLAAARHARRAPPEASAGGDPDVDVPAGLVHLGGEVDDRRGCGVAEEADRHPGALG
jgi:hypothetical protein